MPDVILAKLVRVPRVPNTLKAIAELALTVPLLFTAVTLLLIRTAGISVVEIEPVPVIVSVPEVRAHCVVTAVLIVIVPPLGEGHGAAIDEV